LSLFDLLCGAHFGCHSVVEFATQDGLCKWWRLSFSAAEKEIVLHADGKNSSTNDSTCRKDVLRLLKDDLVEFYRNNRFADEMVSSYCIKTIVLHLLEEHSESQKWASEQLRFRYVEALGRIVSGLERGYIEHYFVAGENILSEKDIPKSQLTAIKQHLLEKQRKYSPTGHPLSSCH